MRQLEQEECVFLSHEPSDPARPPSVVSWVGLPVSGVSSQGVSTGGGGGGLGGSHDGNGTVHNGGSRQAFLGRLGRRATKGLVQESVPVQLLLGSDRGPRSAVSGQGSDGSDGSDGWY